MELEKHDLAKDPPDRELLERLIDEENLDQFLNPRSPSYKAKGLDQRRLTKQQAIDLILDDPNLMKRPLVLEGKKAVFGWKPDEYESKLGL